MKRKFLLFLVINALILTVQLKTGESEINDAQNVLIKLGYDNCYIDKYCGENSLKTDNLYLVITESEYKEYIDSILENSAYRVRITDRNVVQCDDLAITDYKVIYNGTQMVEMFQQPIRIGSGYYDIQLEEKMIGLKKGEEYSVTYLISDNEMYPNMIDEVAEIKVLITDLFRVVVPTVEEYAIKNGYEDEIAFRADVRENLRQDKQKELTDIAVEKLINDLIRNSKFKMDQDIIADNAIGFYYEFMNMASIYGMEIEEYLSKVLELNGNIYDLCYENSAHEIKRYLVICKIASDHNIMVLNQDLMEYGQHGNIQWDNLSSMDKYNIIEYKVKDYLAGKYVKIEEILE